MSKNFDEVKKILEHFRRLEEIDSTSYQAGINSERNLTDIAGEICRLFPKSTENPDGYDPNDQLTIQELSVNLAEWIDIPDRAGVYWLSPFCDGHYINSRIQEVIDYSRPERGLEARYSDDTVPIKLFIKEYYPKAKWMFVPEPKQAVGE